MLHGEQALTFCRTTFFYLMGGTWEKKPGNSQVLYLCQFHLRRPGADDVIVLKKELIHAQTLMDQLTQEREREKEQLEKQFEELNAKYQE